MAISEQRLKELRELILAGKEKAFYFWPEWRSDIRPAVLTLDHKECQQCKRRGRYRRGYIVHHIKHLKDAPELALSIYAPDGSRQLETVCKACHEEYHPESLPKYKPHAQPITSERWD